MCIDTATEIPKSLAKILEEKFWKCRVQTHLTKTPSIWRAVWATSGDAFHLGEAFITSSPPKAKVSSSKDVKEMEGTMK